VVKLRYSLRYLMGLTGACAVAAAFVGKVGAGVAARTWLVAACTSAAACLLIVALPSLRRRVRIVPVVVGAAAAASLAGWLAIAAYSLDVAEIRQEAAEVRHNLPDKCGASPAPAAVQLYWSATVAGAMTGVLLPGAASWLCTGRARKSYSPPVMHRR
jgi:hypothetical protein